MGGEHDALPLRAVRESEQVTDLVGPFLRDPVHQVVLARSPAVELVGKPCRRHDRRPEPRMCKTVDELLALDKNIVRDDQEERVASSRRLRTASSRERRTSALYWRRTRSKPVSIRRSVPRSAPSTPRIPSIARWTGSWSPGGER